MSKATKKATEKMTRADLQQVFEEAFRPFFKEGTDPEAIQDLMDNFINGVAIRFDAPSPAHYSAVVWFCKEKRNFGFHVLPLKTTDIVLTDMITRR